MPRSIRKKTLPILCNYVKTKINIKKSSQLSVVLDDCVALLEHVIIIRISCFDIDFVSQIKLTKPPGEGGLGWDEVPLRGLHQFSQNFQNNL